MKIPFADFTPMHEEVHGEMSGAFESVYKEGWFIQGKNCASFEKNFAEYCGTKFSVGCGNGLDALHMILLALGIGQEDEVIVPAQTYIATGLAVTYAGAKPVYVDIEPEYYALDPEKIEAAITEKTKAIMLVHLYGQIGRFDEIKAIADRQDLFLIEDAAQAHGAEYKGMRAGSLGVAAGFSFYPGKNLGALGDAGGVTTSDADVVDKVKAYANYGSRKKYMHDYKGFNSRLDELQAALLDVKLKNLDRWLADRTRAAESYLDGINNPRIKLPAKNPDAKHAWHIFAVMADEREKFCAYLDEHEVGHQCHYPVPMHLHKAYTDLGYKEGDFPIAEYTASHEVSLPLYYGMTDEQIEYVIKVVNEYGE